MQALLRTMGPMIFNTTVVGQQAAGTHWVVVIGAIWNNHGRNGSVVLLNPLDREEDLTSHEVPDAEFAGRIVSRTHDQGSCFPLHYPTAQPVLRNAEQ